VGADIALEFEDFGVRHRDFAVLRELKRARIGHDRTGELVEIGQAVFERSLAELLTLIQDVAVRDEDLRAELRFERGGRDGPKMRIDHR
jgi:hypothetical protein